MKRKPKAFIVFTDLDNTFTPITPRESIKFAELMKEIQEKENVSIKFCPISGRPADYVVGVMNMLKPALKDVGIENATEYGAGEQGGILVDASRAYVQKYIGNGENEGLKQEILKVVQNSKYSSIVADEPGKRFTCSFHIKDEIEKNLSSEQVEEIYSGLRKLLTDNFGKKISLAKASDCLEAMPKEVSKATALKTIFEVYQRQYDIVGITYSGDAENDKEAVKYVSKLAEIPGVKANVFLPSNANDIISSKSIESWKNKIESAGSKNRILKGNEKFFIGVMNLMKESLEKGDLVGKGISKWETRDDISLNKSNSRLELWASKGNKTKGMDLSI